VKKALANSEPSTHGTNPKWRHQRLWSETDCITDIIYEERHAPLNRQSAGAVKVETIKRCSTRLVRERLTTTHIRIGSRRESLLFSRQLHYLVAKGRVCQEITMFIAMNRFRVAKGSEAAFEQVWLSRDSHLEKVPGFVEFHLLKGPEAEDHTLCASHTVWENRAVFEAWTKSDAFRAAHHKAGDNKPLYLDHLQFEGFEVRQTVGRGAR
jgi:heme-degrading monooxygenase HmoA